MNDGLPLLLLALTVAIALVLFWRVVLALFATALVTVFLVGLIQVAQWVQGLS